MRGSLLSMIGLALLGATCVGIERGLSNVFYNLPEPAGSFEERMKLEKLLVLDPSVEYDVLVLGDSTAKEGFVPAEFTSLTGRSSVNYAISAFVAPVADIYLLEDYLRNHPAPEAIVVGRSIELWGVDPVDPLIRQNFEQVGINVLRFRFGHESWSRFIEGIAASLLPSYQNRHYLQRDFRSMKWFDRDLWVTTPKAIPFPDGGYTGRTETMTEAESNQFLRERLSVLARDGYRPTANNLQLLKHLCQVSRQYGVPMIIASSFHLRSLETNPDFTEAIRATENVLAETATNAGCRFAPSEAAEPSVLRNGTHPNLTGALLYTRRIADLVEKAISPSRPPQ